MKSYHDIVGDGGSNILEQVADQKERIARALSGVRHRVAVGSGKGGVGKSTVTRALAGALAGRGLSVAIADADFNGPTQAQMTGLLGAVPLPGPNGIDLPRSRDGVGVFSVGGFLGEAEPLDFASVSRGDSHTWRATREFAALGEVLASVAWGPLDVLFFDLPPGTERTIQYAEFLGDGAAFVLVTIPSEISRGVVARSVAALAPRRNPVLGYVENMSGYYCADCDRVKPLFPEVRDGVALDLPCLGRVPFDPGLAFACDRGLDFNDLPDTSATRALSAIAGRLVESLETLG
ncbi:MAG TPA: P-loop NTPase [Candidatus Polarisedimenticolaceae bacterium]|nr:P-loop NTPase [Candidatus Polarisedimenticolaceae bacterium]